MVTRRYECTCGGGGTDQGELDLHILDFPDGGHEPTNPDHRSRLIVRHIEKLQRKAEVRAKLAEAAGVTVDDLREALRGP